MKTIKRIVCGLMSGLLIVGPVMAERTNAPRIAVMEPADAVGIMQDLSMAPGTSPFLRSSGSFEALPNTPGSSEKARALTASSCYSVNRIELPADYDVEHIEAAISRANGSLKAYQDPNDTRDDDSLVHSLGGTISYDAKARTVTTKQLVDVSCGDMKMTKDSLKAKYSSNPVMARKATDTQVKVGIEAGGIILGIAIGAGLVIAAGAVPGSLVATAIAAAGGCLGSTIGSVAYSAYLNTNPSTASTNAVWACVKGSVQTGLGSFALANGLRLMCGIGQPPAQAAVAAAVGTAETITGEQTVVNAMTNAAVASSTLNRSLLVGQMVQAMDRVAVVSSRVVGRANTIVSGIWAPGVIVQTINTTTGNAAEINATRGWYKAWAQIDVRSQSW